MNDVLLSVCINTRNRSGYLEETIRSIAGQVTNSIEIIVVDGGSEDDTPAVMKRLCAEYSFVKYFRLGSDVGIDDGYDKSIQFSSGKFCWLMTDDDLIVPGAIDKVMELIQNNHDLIVLNLECYSRDLSLDLQQRLYPIYEDRTYNRNSFDQFFSDLGLGLSYIGCVVIRRSLWFEHSREQYYGSYFVHVGVIFNSTHIDDIYFYNEPVIMYRSANSSWTARSFEIWYVKWPELIWTFENISEHVKHKVIPLKPWERVLSLVKSRAMGEYDISIYNKFVAQGGSGWKRYVNLIVAVFPQAILSWFLLVYCLIFRRNGLYTLYNLMCSSPFPEFSRRIIGLFGLSFPK